MKRKPSTAPVVDSPWATSILPSTSKRPPTDAVRATASAPDAPPPAPASAPLAAPSSLAAPTWSPPPLTPSQSSFVSAPHLGAERQFGADTFGASSQYGSPAQFAPPPQYAPPPQFSPPAQFPPPAQFGSPAQFAPPAPQPAAYQPAAFPPPTNPPSGYQPNRFEPQGYAAPGYQAQGYPPPGHVPPGQAPPYQNVPPTSGRSAGAKVLIGLAIGVVGFIVLCILAAIAIPVFLSQRSKPANRNVVLPATLVEQQQVHDANLDAASASVVASLKQNPIGFSQVQSAYYGSAGDGSPMFMVAAGKLPTRPTAAETKAYFATDANTAAEQLVLNPTGSGPFGGSMECGHAVLSGSLVNVCSSIDNAAGVLVISGQVPTSQLAVLTRQIIGSVEQKG